jgi:hypothetical protein
MGGLRVDNITQRKNVVRYHTQTVVEPKVVVEKPTEIQKIISVDNYIINDESFLIVKDVEYSEVTLKSEKTNKITIKSLTNVLIKTDVGSIDEEWDELLLEKGACVQFQFLEGNWYVIASDGVKFN